MNKTQGQNMVSQMIKRMEADGELTEDQSAYVRGQVERLNGLQ